MARSKDSRFDDDRPRSPRPRLDAPKGKHSRIRGLPCVEEVTDRLLKNYPVQEVAKWIQEDQMECADITRESLVTTLHRYRADLSPRDLSAQVLPEVVVEAEKKISSGLNELEQLEKLFDLQMERVEIGMRFEKSTNILNRYVNQEVALAAQILQKRHNVKMDLGFDGGRDLGTLNVRPELIGRVRNSYGQDVVDVMSNPEARGRALSIVKSLSMIEGSAIEDILGDEDD